MLIRCDTSFKGHFGRRIRWKCSFLSLTQLEVKVRSSQVRLHLQKQNFHSEVCYLVQFRPRIPKWRFYVRRLEMPKNAFQKYQKIIHALFWNSCAQVEFFFTTRCADCMESIGIGTTGSLCYNSGRISDRTRSLCAGANFRLPLVTQPVRMIYFSRLQRLCFCASLKSMRWGR